MPKAAWACLLSATFTEAMRFSMFEQGMTASEAVAKGLIVASDSPPKTAIPHEPAAFAEIQANVYSNSTTSKKTSFCPTMTGKNGICNGSPCDVRNLVYITALKAENLPSQFLDKVDPYMWFWVDNKKNVASTPEYKNNENPIFDWACPFAYDGDLNFDGEVWDSDITADDLVGEVASGGGIKIDEHFLQDHDKDGDGRFELGLFIYKNGNKVSNKRSGDSMVRFRFELLKAPGYEIRRKGSGRVHSRSRSRSRSRH